MIDFIRDWAGQLAVAVVIATLLEMIIPNGKIKKYIKMVIGIYVVFCIIAPFINENISLSEYNLENVIEEYSKSKETVNQSSMDKRLEELYIEELEKDVANKIKKKGFLVNKCKIDATLNSTSENAGINKIELKVVKDETGSDNIQKIDEVKIGISSNKKGNNIDDADKNIIIEFLCEEYEITQDKIKIN